MGGKIRSCKLDKYYGKNGLAPYAICDGNAKKSRCINANIWCYLEKFEFEINEHIMPPQHATPRQTNTAFTRTQPWNSQITQAILQMKFCTVLKPLVSDMLADATMNSMKICLSPKQP